VTTIWIDITEFYPVYVPALSDAGRRHYGPIEVPDETIARWAGAAKAFKEAQHEMLKLVDLEEYEAMASMWPGEYA
jgi:hypothetical protein